MSQVTRITSSDVWGKILCYADNIHAAEVCKLFNTYMQKAMSLEWNGMAKNETLQARIKNLMAEQSLDLNKIFNCFAALYAKQKDLDFPMPNGQLFFSNYLPLHLGQFSAQRFIEAERGVSAELDRNLMSVHAVLQNIAGFPALAGLTADQFRNWLRDPLNEPALNAVTRLDFVYSGLTQIPEEITFFINLEFLDLIGNQLRTIPAYLAKLNKLSWLRIQTNPLEFIAPGVWPLLPYYFCGEPNLQNIPHANLREIPFIVWFRTACLIPRADLTYNVAILLSPITRSLMRTLNEWLEYQDRIIEVIVRLSLLIGDMLFLAPFFLVDASIWAINVLLQEVIARLLDMIRAMICLPNSVRIQ